MKRLVSLALAATLLTGTAAAAAPYDHGGERYYRGHDNNDGAAFVAGVGLIALAAILASQHNHHYHRGWYGRDGWHDGYARGYDGRYDGQYRDYGYRYDNQYQGYSGYDRR